MKKTCKEIQALLTLHLAGDLSPVGQARIQKHLATCADCQAALAELQPAFAEIREALAAPADAPRLSPDRHHRILNAARAAAAHPPTFADRLARWLDAGLPPATRYLFLRTALPVALTLLIVIGVGSMMLPSLSMSHKHADLQVVSCAMNSAMAPREIEKLEELRDVRDESVAAPEDLYFGGIAAGPKKKAVEAERPRAESEALSKASDRDDRSYKADKSYEVVNRLAQPASQPEPAAEDKEMALGDMKLEESAAPVVIGGLWGARSAGGRQVARKDSGVVNSPAPATTAPAAPAAAGKPSSTGYMLASDKSDGSDRSDKSDLSDFYAFKSGESREKKEHDSVSLFRAYGVNPTVETAKQPFSTFSIDVDTASYTFTRNSLLQGRLPPPEAVRTEEIVNFFDYHYSPPPAEALFAVHSQCAPAPFRPGQQLLRIGVKARHLGREENRHAVLTFAIDTSGSMSSPERLGLVQQALRLLVDKLSPEDVVGLVQFDNHARLVLDYTRASDKARILKAINALQTSGSTNLEEGMRLAYESARRAFQPGAGNRVLLLSDGAANLGSATADEILAVVADSRRQGIFCSVYGVGRGGLNDAMLETLANKGDGSYVYLDSLDEARRVFVDDLSATLNTVAADVKIQVEFTPSRVEQYRQLGYENRQLKKEDFRDNAIDAGEVGSGQSVTALYELGLAPGSRGPLGVVRIRYRDLRTGRIEEIAAPLAESMLVPAFDQAEPAFQLAACAAEWAEILRGSPYAAGDEASDVAGRLRRAALAFALDSRVQELLRLVETTSQLKRGNNE